MKVKFILPALTEATSPLFRPVKYSLFPPLGLASLASWLSDDHTAELVDEHVERLHWDDEPDLVVIQTYITNAHRAYEIADHYRAKGAHVCIGGLHATSLPEEAAVHCDTLFLGPGDSTFPRFLREFEQGASVPRYVSSESRSIVGIPPVRRDLIKRHLYLVPNSIVVTRGCPHHCNFCYKDAFFEGGRGFYTQAVDEALAEIDRLPGQHLYFLDDHLLGSPRFARELFAGMKGMGRLFQGAATVDSILRGDLIEAAAEAGLRSLFVGFESLDENNLHQSQKHQNLGRDYAEAIRRLHSLGIMINGSFVFGLDSDGPDVFDRTVDWAVTQGLTTATFHVLTPYPGTGQFQQIESEGRLLHRDWRLYDTRHAVYRPLAMTPDQLETGYWKAYDDFYSWANVCKGASTHDRFEDRARHFAYTAGWKKFEGAWNAVIRARRLTRLRPALERILTHHRASVPGDQREDRGEIAPIERRPQPPSNTEAPSGSWVGVPAEPIPQGSRLVGDEGGSHERVVLLPTKAR